MSDQGDTPAAENEETVARPVPEGGAGLVLVIGPPRCGTTMVFDALRCHPYARFERASAMFGRFTRGAHFRYPKDLCVQSGGIRVEMKKGDVVRVPSFGWSEDDNIGGWMVEKLHPHFFLQDVDWLLARVGQLEAAGAPVKLVLQVRSPRAMLRSQWLYKRRVPSWSEWLAEESMVGFARSAYEAMGRLREQRPEAVLSVYEESKTAGSFAELYSRVWPGEDWSEHAAEVSERTSVKSRGALAEQRFTAGTDAFDEEEFKKLLKSGATDLRACDKAYKSVLE